MSLPIGIHFGTTNCAACVLRQGVPEPVPLEGSPVMPSVVSFTEDGTILVGQAAKDRRCLAPESTVASVKRFLGDPTQRWTIFGQTYTPTDIAALLLRRLREAAERSLGTPVVDAVLTVPAYFRPEGKDALKEAAKRAGLRVLGLLSEPIAVAVAHGFGRDKPGIILVYHLGGGTFTADVIAAEGSEFSVLASDGDLRLGGDDLDFLLAEHLFGGWGQRTRLAPGPFASLFSSEPGAPREQRLAAGRLMAGAEGAKWELSRGNKARVCIPRFLGGTLDEEVTRETYHAMIAPLVERTMWIVHGAMGRAGLARPDMNAVLFSGGATHDPSIRERIAREFKAPVGPEVGFAPVGAAAAGAAILAERSGEGAEPKPYLDENVQFTVYRPVAVKPAEWYTMLAFAHLSERPPDAPPEEPSPIEQVREAAEQALGKRLPDYRGLTQDSLEAVPREGEITLVPKMDGVEFNPRRASFSWVESVHRADFRLRANPHLDGETARGRLSIFLGRILLADIPLAIRVEGWVTPRPGREPREAVGCVPYRRIFASYSHKDLAIVEEFERHARALGDRYLRDQVDLRAGEVWDERLKGMIDEADVFQLFWSRESMVSPFVKQEWEHALGLGRPNFVRGCYWEDPFPEDKTLDLPPPALAKLQFENLRRPGGAHQPAVQPADAPEEKQGTPGPSSSTPEANPPRQEPVRRDMAMTLPPEPEPHPPEPPVQTSPVRKDPLAADGSGASVFEYLLSRSTLPDELLSGGDLCGPVDIERYYAAVAGALRDAHRAFDEASCRKLVAQWHQVTETSGVQPSAALGDQVKVIESWLREIDEQSSQERAYAEACTALGQELDKGARWEVLEKRMAAVAWMGRGVPDVLAARYASRMEGLRRPMHRRFRLRVVRVVAAAMVAGIVLYAVILWLLRR